MGKRSAAILIDAGYVWKQSCEGGWEESPP